MHFWLALCLFVTTKLLFPVHNKLKTFSFALFKVSFSLRLLKNFINFRTVCIISLISGHFTLVSVYRVITRGGALNFAPVIGFINRCRRRSRRLKHDSYIL